MPVGYFHVVFTVPAAVAEVAFDNLEQAPDRARRGRRHVPLQGLPPPRLGLPRRLPAEAMARVRGYQRASKADATMRAYRADAAAFDAWCRQHELQQQKRYYLLAVQLLLIA